MKIGLWGASGRMGQAIVRLGVDAGVDVVSIDRKATKLPKVAAVIDASSADGTVAIAKLCGAAKTPLLVCTTGHTKAHLTAVQKAMKTIRWALVPNTSPGVHALKRALAAAIAALPERGLNARITEVHHVHKKDKPSGTALALATVIGSAPIESVREGEIIGVHEVEFELEFEKITFRHEALNRDLFARGALDLAQKLPKVRGSKRPLAIEDLFDA